jgi:hypothetical protein
MLLSAKLAASSLSPHSTWCSGSQALKPLTLQLAGALATSLMTRIPMTKTIVGCEQAVTLAL